MYLPMVADFIKMSVDSPGISYRTIFFVMFFESKSRTNPLADLKMSELLMTWNEMLS